MVEEDDDVEEDEDEDDGKEPRMTADGGIVTTLADDVDSMVDNQRFVLPEQGQEMHEYTPQPQPLARAPQPQTLAPCLRPQTLKTYPFTGLQDLVHVMP